MKKKIIAIPALLIIAAGMTYWFFGYEETLPEPSQETLDYITKEFNDLTLEESVEKILAQKKEFDFFIEQKSDGEIYNKRKTVAPENEEYKNAFSVLTPEEYQSRLNEIITKIEFIQHIEHEYSLIYFVIPAMPTERQPTMKIRKITYMDGSEDIKDRKISTKLKLNTKKTIKSIDINVRYRYVSDLASYQLSPDKPEIKQEKYTLKLAVRDDNYLRYTLDGNLNIVGEDVINKTGKVLSPLSCSSGHIGYIDKMERFVNGSVKVSRYYNKNKDALIKKVAGYYERFELETNQPATYISECTYYGTPEAITIYAVNIWAREEKNITQTPVSTSLYHVVENEKTNDFYIIDQSGNYIVNYGKEKLHEIGLGYFFTRHTENKKDEDDGDESESTYYHLYKLDTENKKLNHVMKVNRVYSLSNDAFVIADNKNIQIFNVNHRDPIVIPIENSRINQVSKKHGRFNLFYYKDGKGTHVINNKGEHIVPVDDYWIENGGDNTIKVKNSIFRGSMATKDKKTYFINKDGTIRLTLKGYDKVGDISNKMIKAERDRLYGFTDLKGNERVAPDYQEVRDFDNAYALVRKNNHWGVINDRGEVVIPFKYSDHYSLSSTNGLMSYSIDGQHYTMQELLKENGVKTEKTTAAEH